MYAISFDMNISSLQQTYNSTHYNNAYYEIQNILKEFGFIRIQGSVYINDQQNSLSFVYRAIETLKQVDWFKKSVVDIRVFKIEDWSNFTDIIKN
ncbi:MULTISPECIES: virulence protein [Campylobacter]|uniref:virulence protein n=1 Tax=Campylobacter TaxID=194 RepID=UPI001115D83E|nr:MULTISPECIES: virulence protein [Campylobacter]MBF7068200.1 virulence protein [Campylobacter volucris]